MIRDATESDAEAILAIYAPFCLESAVTFEEVPPTLDEMRARIRKAQASYAWLVFEADGQLAGYAYGTRHRERAAYRWSAEVAIYVADGRRGQGIGRRLYEALFSRLADRGYVEAFAGVVLPNPASLALHEAVGFRRIGVFEAIGFKLGAWHDVAWMQRSLRTRETPPTEPASD